MGNGPEDAPRKIQWKSLLLPFLQCTIVLKLHNCPALTILLLLPNPKPIPNRRKVLTVGHWMKTAIAIPMTLAAPPHYYIHCALYINIC